MMALRDVAQGDRLETHGVCRRGCGMIYLQGERSEFHNSEDNRVFAEAL